LLNALILSNINQFSKFFYYQNQEKICNNIIIKDPTTLQMCRYTSLWNVSVLKATIENKIDDFCNNTDTDTDTEFYYTLALRLVAE